MIPPVIFPDPPPPDDAGAASYPTVAIAVAADGFGAMAMAVVAAASAAAGLCHRPKCATVPLCVLAVFYSAGGRFDVLGLLPATVIT